jgi:hypothetical protein
MNSSITVVCDIHLERRDRGRVAICNGPAPASDPQGRIPRVTRLMGLAIHFENLLREGALKDYAEIARLGHVSRARVTQIMNLLLLAPDIQEEILFLPAIGRGRERLHLRDLQCLAALSDWQAQRQQWHAIRPQ